MFFDLILWSFVEWGKFLWGVCGNWFWWWVVLFDLYLLLFLFLCEVVLLEEEFVYLVFELKLLNVIVCDCLLWLLVILVGSFISCDDLEVDWFCVFFRLGLVFKGVLGFIIIIRGWEIVN